MLYICIAIYYHCLLRNLTIGCHSSNLAYLIFFKLFITTLIYIVYYYFLSIVATSFKLLSMLMQWTKLWISYERILIIY